MPREPLKIAISSGPAYIGRFGGNLSALGRPLIEASRLISHKDLQKIAFEEDWKRPHPDRPLILASQQFAEDFGLDQQGATTVDGRWQLKGLQGDRLIYKVQLH